MRHCSDQPTLATQTMKTQHSVLHPERSSPSSPLSCLLPWLLWSSLWLSVCLPALPLRAQSLAGSTSTLPTAPSAGTTTVATNGSSAAAPAPAGANDIATAPLRFLASSAVKPNLHFILDDSGSMQWSYLGDEVVAHGYENSVGYRSSACNKIYYNPQVRYLLPLDSLGQPYPAQDFDAAAYDGFQPGSLKVNLATSFMAWRNANTSPPVPASTASVRYTPDCWSEAGHCIPGGGLPHQPVPAHYFVYAGNLPDRLGQNGIDDHCRDKTTDALASRWRRVVVGSTSGPGGSDERQNFANWFSYHRTRMLTMKTAVGRAFAQLDARMRVGYSTTSDTGVDSTQPGFLAVSDLDAAHRKRLYDKLYAVVPVSGTPLRGALAKAGRLYAGQLLRGDADPVRYSCQQNYTLLSTDGYWNTDGETPDYGPRRIDGRTPVGDADHHLPRPKFDGSGSAQAPRVATLTLSPVHTSTSPSFTAVRNITVDGKAIMSRHASVLHPAEGNPLADAIALARRLAASINLNGYRAFAELNIVTVVAPAGAARLGGRPVVDSLGSLPVIPSEFGAPSGRAEPRTNTLADIAAYYAYTDLRQPAFGNCGKAGELCENDVLPLPGRPDARHQHMVTHTLGLGATGTLRYREDYDTASDGDFRAIIDGRLDWPDPIFYPGGERIDDLWHAAVNGGGRYFSARNPEVLARVLAEAMATIRASSGAASAAATSSQQPVSGQDLLFASRHRSVYWDGDLDAQRLAILDGQLKLTSVWSASALLDGQAGDNSDTRRLLMPSTSSASGLKAFQWRDMDTAEQAMFSGLCAGTGSRRLSQCATMTDEQRARFNGQRLVNYLRGQRVHEDTPARELRLFRAREHLLGAPVNASPLYVGAPPFRYADDGYGEFREIVARNRTHMVYLPANDGMLHAFDAQTGHERWAFIPSAVLPELWRVADAGWSAQFSYLHDGTPVAGDICPSAPASTCSADRWRTILVGGLGAGGRAYYALDITNPEQPVLLWQFDVSREPQLGLAIGRPLITKRRDGRWVVVLTSGPSNINPGNGRGMIFVLDAASGALLSRIDTEAGSNTRPAGLVQINAWLDSTLDNTAARIYGGDLSGNVWRFDINEPGSAMLLAQLDHDGRPQAVSTRPALTLHRIGNRQIVLVTVATGRLFGIGDLADKSVQSIYTFRDDLGSQGLGRLQGASRMVRQQLSAAAEERTLVANNVDWTRHDGWYLNLDVMPGAGERVTLDPVQQMGVLRVITNVPDGAPCQPRAQSWLYQLSVSDGMHVPVDGPIDRPVIIARRVSGQGLTSGASAVWLDGRSTLLLTDESGKISAESGVMPAAASSTARRVSWRELA